MARHGRLCFIGRVNAANPSSSGSPSPVAKARPRRLRRAALVVVGLLATAYAAIVVLRAARVYGFLKANVPMLTPHVVQYDPVLGYRARPGAAGAMLMSLPPDAPLQYDAHGFRVPVGRADRPLVPPLILTLGDSFTHGDGILAEQTYSYRLGSRVGGTVMNGGFCGYGPVQMLLRARELIPALRPALVVVQYSPWFVQRGFSLFPPTTLGVATQPYFSRDERGKLYIAPPPFRPHATDLPAADYRGTPSGWRDFLAFFGRVGAPLIVGNDADLAELWLRHGLGLVPPPAGDGEEMLRRVYGEIRDLCRRAGSRLVVVGLGMGAIRPRPADVGVLRGLAGVTYVDAYAPLVERLPKRPGSSNAENLERFMRTYAQYRGDPPVLVDSHPNADAHAIIGDTLAEAVSAAGGLSRRGETGASPR